MMLHCTNCKKKFFQSNVDSELEGKVVECKYCNQKLLYESRTKYLDNRLIELNKDLDYTESKINLRKQEYEDQIVQEKIYGGMNIMIIIKFYILIIFIRFKIFYCTIYISCKIC